MPAVLLLPETVALLMQFSIVPVLLREPTMAAIYLRQIRAGKRTLEQVPEYWREQVRAMLEQKTEDK